VLNAGRFRHGGTDRELFATIRNGIPNTEMPAAFNLPDIEIWRIVGHVQRLGRQGSPEQSTGDPAAGAAVYQKNACVTCHTIDGAGGLTGPDLSDIGAKRALRHLRESVVDPGADIPLDYRLVTITDRRGKSISGIHLNEDEYSIHLRDVDGTLRSFMKSDLTAVALPRQSLMPRYASLSAADLENLVAYLASRRQGAKDRGVEGSTDLREASKDRRQGSQERGERSDQVVWMFDRLENIGGHPTTVLGNPRVIDSPIGKAVEFDGIDDALFVDDHPLAGAEQFTWEAIFRPDGGEREQRWFHLSERDPVSGQDTDNRMLFEIRVAGDQWFLDSYNQSGTAGKALMNRTALHPLREWYHVASVYDGREFSNYVNGTREGSAEIAFTPHRQGHASIGVRINKMFYFKGAVRLARFTRRALPPSEFLRRTMP
jgi:putative heme-binding domain-containing protein